MTKSVQNVTLNSKLNEKGESIQVDVKNMGLNENPSKIFDLFIEVKDVRTLMLARQILIDVAESDLGIEDKNTEEAYRMKFIKKQKSSIDDYVSRIGSLDKELLMKNINVLLRENQIKMSDLESFLDISPGYISRTMKAGSDKRLSSEHLYKISRLFKVDIDRLVSYDMDYINTQETKLSSFFSRIRSGTNANVIKWRKFDTTEPLQKCYEFYANISSLNLPFDDELAIGVKYTSIEDKANTYFMFDDPVICASNGTTVQGMVIVPYGTANQAKQRKLSSCHFDGYRFICTQNDVFWSELFTTKHFSETFREEMFRLYTDIKASMSGAMLSQELLAMIDGFED